MARTSEELRRLLDGMKEALGRGCGPPAGRPPPAAELPSEWPAMPRAVQGRDRRSAKRVITLAPVADPRPLSREEEGSVGRSPTDLGGGPPPDGPRQWHALAEGLGHIPSREGSVALPRDSAWSAASFGDVLSRLRRLAPWLFAALASAGICLDQRWAAGVGFAGFLLSWFYADSARAAGAVELDELQTRIAMLERRAASFRFPGGPSQEQQEELRELRTVVQALLQSLERGQASSWSPKQGEADSEP